MRDLCSWTLKSQRSLTPGAARDRRAGPASVVVLATALALLTGCGAGGKDTKAHEPVIVSGQALFQKRVVFSGNFTNTLEFRAIRHALVVAVSDADSNRVLGQTTTDEDGVFSLAVDNNVAAFRLRVYAKTKEMNLAVEVVNPDDAKLGDGSDQSYYPWYVESDVLIESTPFVSINALLAPGPNCSEFSSKKDARRVAPPFNIFDVLVKGASFLNRATGLRAPKIYALWEDERTPPAISGLAASGQTAYLGARTTHSVPVERRDSNGRPYFIGLSTAESLKTAIANPAEHIFPNWQIDGTGTVTQYHFRANGDDTFSMLSGSRVLFSDLRHNDVNGIMWVSGDFKVDPDHYDDHVILGAYARFLQHIYSKDDAPPAEAKIRHISAMEMHDVRRAWSQGWADFFACYVLRDPDYLDTTSILEPCKASQAAATDTRFDIENVHGLNSFAVQKMMARWPLVFHPLPNNLNSIPLVLDDSVDRNVTFQGNVAYDGWSRGSDRRGELKIEQDPNSATGVLLTWEAQPAASGYNVYRVPNTTPPTTPLVAPNTPLNAAPLAVTVTTYLDAMPPPGATGNDYAVTYIPTGGGTEVPLVETETLPRTPVPVTWTGAAKVSQCINGGGQQAVPCVKYQGSPTLNEILAASGTGYSLASVVAALLWDIADDTILNTDGDTFTSRGFLDVWDVMHQYLPAQTWVYLGDFLDGWYALGKGDPANTASFDTIQNRLGIFHNPPARTLIGSITNPSTSPVDTFPHINGLFGASKSNPVTGNALLDPAPVALGDNPLRIDADSQDDPFDPIAPGKGSFPGTGSVAGARAVWRSSSSFYAIEIPVGGRLRIELHLPDTTGNLDLFLYGPSQEAVAHGLSTGTGATEVVDVSVTPGIYYLEVRSWQVAAGAVNVNKTTGPYQLLIFRPN